MSISGNDLGIWGENAKLESSNGFGVWNEAPWVSNNDGTYTLTLDLKAGRQYYLLTRADNRSFTIDNVEEVN